MQSIPNKFIFMKVGKHAGEDFDQILKRKQKEIDDTGLSFWGYGGNTLHPTKHVQPFIKSYIKKGNLYLLMNLIDSKADPDVSQAQEYSDNLIDWRPIPDGIIVTGSRYALILGDILPGSLDLNINNYQVGIGNSTGKFANEYLRGRIDKGCFIKSDVPNTEVIENKKQISFISKLQSPYAVFLR